MARAALAGTRQAYDKCPGCGCSRIRHPAGPGSQCMGTTWVTVSGYGSDALPIPRRCPCTRTADFETGEG